MSYKNMTDKEESKKYDIVSETLSTEVPHDVSKLIEDFVEVCQPIEKTIFVFADTKTQAHYCECHINAEALIRLSTTDVPLDPDEQAEYRANREIVEDDVAFEQMKSDALEGRVFSNIVAEFDTTHNPRYPIKIVGGQHRHAAIKAALKSNVNAQHGLKIYFALDKEQRLDVQLISNTNIDVSTDLYDRLQETATGPQLRTWCQEVGFLDQGKDFSAKRQKSGLITVRAIRSFILNFYLGNKIDIANFENEDTNPALCKTGKLDDDWEKLRKENTGIWTDEALKKAAREFVLLNEAQRAIIQENYKQNNKTSLLYAEKAHSFSILSAWAYVAGVLQSNATRLEKHYKLRDRRGKDPLNADAMARGRHKSDPENYRGLGTRNDVKERGRCVELFFLQAENGGGIISAVIDAAIKRHFTKQAKLDQLKAEKKIPNG
jgi:hypothetical protein